jgi:phosphonate dehydrogenase
VKPAVAVTARIHPRVLDRLRQRFQVVANADDSPWTAERRLEACRDAQGLMAFMTDRIDREFLLRCPNLRAVAACLKGGDGIDLAACKDRGVRVHLSGELLTEPTAELATALLLSLCRGILEGDRMVRAGRFSGWSPSRYGRTLRRSRVFVAGLGPVGRAVGRNLFRLGADVSGCDVDLASCVRARDMGIEVVSEDGMRDASMVVLCLPLRPSTTGWFSAERISTLEPGALVVNVGRGSTVDEEAVAAALASGRLGGWAADVFAFEDLSVEERPLAVHPDWIRSDRTLLTPHLGSAVDEVRLSIEMEAVAALEDMLLDGSLLHG